MKGCIVKLSVLGAGTGVAASSSMKCGLNAPLTAVNEGSTLPLDGLYVGENMEILKLLDKTSIDIFAITRLKFR